MTDPDGTVGFTGVEWDQRSPADLARALSAGPGPGQAGELAAAWSAVAHELEAVASEYRRLAVDLSADWVSAATPDLDARSREVADDVFGLAAQARELTERSGGHAHNHTIARAAMPRTEEIEATGRALDALDSLGPGLVGVLTGATDALETRTVDLRKEAATVMAHYEARTAPLAVPRETPAPTRHLLPGLVARAGGSGDPAPADTGRTGADSAPVVGGPAATSAASAAPLAAYAAVGGARAEHPTGTQVRPATAGPAGTGAPGTAPAAGSPALAGSPTGGPAERFASAVPMVPPMGGAAGATGGSDDAHHADQALRPSPGPTEIEELYGLSVAVAPPVFGATAAAPAAGPAGGGLS